MFQFRSILSRVAWLHVAALGLAAIAIPAASYLLVYNITARLEERVLRSHDADIARHLHFTEGHWRLDLPQDLRTYYDHGFDGFAFVVRDERGDILSKSPRADLQALSPRRGFHYFQRRNGSKSFVETYPEIRDGRTVFISIGQDLTYPDVIFDDVIFHTLGLLSSVTIPITLLVIAIDILVIRRELRPVREASERARSIDPQRIGIRLPTGRIPAEISPLVEAFNKALERLERGLISEREFTADAAHELRTPLSVLRARIDSFPDQEAVGALKRDVDVMSRIVSQLLEIAELEAAPCEPEEMIDLRSVCARVVDHISPIAASAGQHLVLSGTKRPVLITGDVDMIFRAIRNLVENAVKFSPSGGRIDVRVEDGGFVSVSDEGPGVAETDRQLIFRRFWRRDRSRQAGAGLGLSIVSRIVAVHNGTIGVDNVAGGGAKFTIRFPFALTLPETSPPS